MPTGDYPRCDNCIYKNECNQFHCKNCISIRTLISFHDPSLVMRNCNLTGNFPCVISKCEHCAYRINALNSSPKRDLYKIEAVIRKVLGAQTFLAADIREELIKQIMGQL